MRPGGAGMWGAGNSRRAACLLALAFAGCGGNHAPVPAAAGYADPGFVESGAWRMRYALTLTTDLPAEIAGSYDIVQRRNLALLMVTLERIDAPPGQRIDAETVEAESVAITGERRSLVLVRHDEPGGPTWVAPVEVLHRVPFTIEIRARADAASPTLRARLTRELRLE